MLHVPWISTFDKVRTQEKITVLFGNFSQMADPPPFWEPLIQKKKLSFILHFMVWYDNNEDDFICENQWQNKRRFGSIIFVSRSPDLRDLPASIIVTKYVTQSNLYIKDGHGW